MLVEAREVHFHLVGEDGKVEKTIKLDDFKKEVELDEWFKIGDVSYIVQRIAIEKDRVDIYVKPLKKENLN